MASTQNIAQITNEMVQYKFYNKIKNLFFALAPSYTATLAGMHRNGKCNRAEKPD